MKKVFVTLVGKNEEEHIGAAIKAILNQTHPIAGMVYVDDGSTDGSVLEARYALAGDYPIIERPYRKHGPNLVGQPAMGVLVNIGLDHIMKNHRDEYDFMLNMNASIYLPNDYIEKLVEKFEMDKNLVIASGGLYVNDVLTNKKAPSGAGRMIRKNYFKWYGERLPIYYGWESEMTHTAMRIEKTVAVFPEIPFYSLKGQRQKRLNYVHWGRGMRALGYSFITTVFRGIKLTIARKNAKVFVSILAGYFSQHSNAGDLNKWERERTLATRKWHTRYEILHKTNIILSHLFNRGGI